MSTMTQQETYLVHLFKKMDTGDREHLIALSTLIAARSQRNSVSHLTLVAGGRVSLSGREMSA